MPIEKKIKSPDGTIGVWKLNETDKELFEQSSLCAADLELFTQFSAERRKKEFLATRLVLKQLLNTETEIIYEDSTGKPSLRDNSYNISISHSADFAAVMVSDKKIGIDIEQTTRRIDRIASRFLHPDEQSFIAKMKANQQEARVLLWAAKEAIFKCSDFQGIEFNQQIILEPFRMKAEGEFYGSLFHSGQKEHYLLNYSFFENNVMVYCVEI